MPTVSDHSVLVWILAAVGAVLLTLLVYLSLYLRRKGHGLMLSRTFTPRGYPPEDIQIKRYLRFVLVGLMIGVILCAELIFRIAGHGTYPKIFFFHLPCAIAWLGVTVWMSFFTTGVKNRRVHKWLGAVFFGLMIIVIVTGIILVRPYL
jgi:hypothetical protein